MVGAKKYLGDCMKIQVSKNKEIFDFGKPYIIAEIGANHNGDMELAKKMIDSAKECGADAVKFQSWTPESLVSEGEYKKNQSYDDCPKKHFGSLKEMVDKYYLRTDEHFELKRYCDSIDIDFNSTPFSNEEVDLLNELGVEFYKVASMDISNYGLLEYMASFNKPMILSTGMATLSEIEKAIHIIESKGNDKIVLLHCISIYPPENKDIHLNNITMLRNTFGYPVGFSDHTIGFSIPLASAALGACVIEKHFTIDKSLPGWDHAISADPFEMKIICDESSNIAEAMGGFKRTVSAAEQEKKLKFRRSAVVKEGLPSGHVLREEDVLFKRPGTGIEYEELKYVIGRTLNKALDADDLIAWENLV
jgi:N-acetylneuraminate synthase